MTDGEFQRLTPAERDDYLHQAVHENERHIEEDASAIAELRAEMAQTRAELAVACLQINNLAAYLREARGRPALAGVN